MRFNVLASGSSGNATLISTGKTSVLIDCGLSVRELVKRLEFVDSSLDEIDAILITHEHSDHIRGLKTLSKNPNIRIYISPLALSSSVLKNEPKLNLGETLKGGEAFEIGDLKVFPIKTPHDSVDPLVFRLESCGVKMAVVTDLGYIPKSVAYELRDCDALVLEANHEIDMLRVSSYPWTTKQRILSQVGHLSNKEMSRFLKEDFDGKANYLVLAHLSEKNNHPEIARLAALEALSSQTPLFATLNEQKVSIAKPDIPLGWINL
jgi:phosphoribosyl 1,2-cyclic phosphodiesterase